MTENTEAEGKEIGDALGLRVMDPDDFGIFIIGFLSGTHYQIVSQEKRLDAIEVFRGIYCRERKLGLDSFE